MIHPPDTWVWCGEAGHFICASDCRFHLCTRVGNHRISTVGDYRPRGGERQEIGYKRFYETMVFAVAGDGVHGEGGVTDWCEVETDAYVESEDACVGHMKMCLKYAEVVDAG